MSEMSDQEGRFRTLNSILGWGNPNAKIIHIGIEEAGNWSILEVLSGFLKCQILQNKHIHIIWSKFGELKTAKNNSYDYLDMILKVMIGRSLLECLDEYINYYATNAVDGIRITDDNKTTKLSQMERFQHYITQSLIRNDSHLNVSAEDNDSINFGTTKGNEICLNYYPIGRSRMSSEYPEYSRFFGLYGSQRFYIANPDIDYEEERLNLLHRFIHKKIEKNEKLVLFTYGMIDTFRSLFAKKFGFSMPVERIFFKIPGRGKYYYHFEIDNLRVFNIYHPSHKWISYTQVDELIQVHLEKS